MVLNLLGCLNIGCREAWFALLLTVLVMPFTAAVSFWRWVCTVPCYKLGELSSPFSPDRSMDFWCTCVSLAHHGCQRLAKENAENFSTNFLKKMAFEKVKSS